MGIVSEAVLHHLGGSPPLNALPHLPLQTHACLLLSSPTVSFMGYLWNLSYRSYDVLTVSLDSSGNNSFVRIPSQPSDVLFWLLREGKGEGRGGG